MAGADTLGELERASVVGRPHASVQTEPRVVRDLQRILVPVVRDHRQDRSEDLLLRDRRVGVDATEDGGCHIEPAVKVGRRLDAADGQLGSRVDPRLNVGEHPVALRGRDHGTEPRGRVQRIAGDKPGCELGGQGDGLVVPVRRNDHPGPGGAGLPTVEEGVGDTYLDGGIEVGVIEDDIGRLTAELQRNTLDGPRGYLRDAGACCR